MSKITNHGLIRSGKSRPASVIRQKTCKSPHCLRDFSMLPS